MDGFGIEETLSIGLDAIAIVIAVVTIVITLSARKAGMAALKAADPDMKWGAADPDAKPVKNPESIRRWLRDGTKGLTFKISADSGESGGDDGLV